MIDVVANSPGMPVWILRGGRARGLACAPLSQRAAEVPPAMGVRQGERPAPLLGIFHGRLDLLIRMPRAPRFRHLDPELCNSRRIAVLVSLAQDAQDHD